MTTYFSTIGRVLAPALLVSALVPFLVSSAHASDPLTKDIERAEKKCIPDKVSVYMGEGRIFICEDKRIDDLFEIFNTLSISKMCVFIPEYAGNIKRAHQSGGYSPESIEHDDKALRTLEEARVDLCEAKMSSKPQLQIAS
ncbi:MAG: hypothetical protein J0L77_08000 [Alphaproteobacteria bacterium]|nr:hypothetical protein [Alphaproteobacteria bacterium]